MKYWIMVFIYFSLLVYGLLNCPVYYWKNPNIIVKKIKITNRFGLIYYKNCKKDIEKLDLYYKIKF